jgi:uncharacterized protein YecT (DUF1311 family)
VPRPISIGLLVLALSLGAHVGAQTQLEMNRDAGRTLRDAEAKLDAVVTTYRKRLDPSQRAAFDESQRRWVAYRKAACEFEASGVAGGSAYSMILAACLTDYANHRLDIVTKLMNCSEGDLSCPAFKRGS